MTSNWYEMNIYGAHTRAPALAHRVRESERGRETGREKTRERMWKTRENTQCICVWYWYCHHQANWKILNWIPNEWWAKCDVIVIGTAYTQWHTVSVNTVNNNIKWIFLRCRCGRRVVQRANRWKQREWVRERWIGIEGDSERAHIQYS